VKEIAPQRACIVGGPESKAAALAQELGLEPLRSASIRAADLILIGDLEQFAQQREAVMLAVEKGATAVFIELPAGQLEILGDTLEIAPCGMKPRHFSSRATGHPLVAGFAPADFRFWYDASAGYVTPLLATTFTAPGWTPILTSGNGNWSGDWEPALAAAEKRHGRGYFRICQVCLVHRTRYNPAAGIFARRLLGLGE